MENTNLNFFKFSPETEYQIKFLEDVPSLFRFVSIEEAKTLSNAPLDYECPFCQAGIPVTRI